MIAERSLQNSTTDELAVYLCDASLDGYLTELEFDEIITKLRSSHPHPEVLLNYLGFGEPAWRTKHLRRFGA
jgi:hypothetical protein